MAMFQYPFSTFFNHKRVNCARIILPNAYTREKRMKAIVALIQTLFTLTQADEVPSKGVVSPPKEGGEQDWGYETVRPGAYMFWWLYYTVADVTEFTDNPLVMWLQGGPGASSTAYGNFAELGPLDLDLNKRNSTWIKRANVVFVDNPVGTGFSYVENTSRLTTTNREIATDFIEMLRGFYKKHPEFISTPLYIVSESYGGKMAIEIALVLDEAIKKGTIKSNFIGVGLGDAWVDPVTIVRGWAPYLFAIGAVDQAGHDAIAAAALRTKQLFDQGQYAESTSQWRETEYVVGEKSMNVDFYNILEPVPSRSSRYSSRDLNEPIAKPQARQEEDIKIDTIMASVKKRLGLNSTWDAQSEEVFSTLATDFMKNVTAITQTLLDTTDIKVAVFNGQLDLIVCTSGVSKWLDKLLWSGSNEWATASRPAFSVNGVYEGYQKTVGNLGMFWVNRAGHMVPADNPAAMDYILRWLTQDYNSTIQRK